MATPDMRHLACECVLRAREFLAHGDETSARHACLELRFSIEYITYGYMQAYRSELPYDALKKWTPRQIISQILEIDPNADQSITIWAGIEPSYGVEPPPEEMQFVGEDRRFSLKWANKNYNVLGNYLHAPTIHQIESGSVPTLAMMIKKATEIVNECEQILNSTIFNVNFGQFFEFECGDCKMQIRKRAGNFTTEQGIVCPKCRATYDITSIEENKVILSFRKATYTCRHCSTGNEVGVHRVEDGTVLACAKCGKKAMVKQRFELIDEDNTQPTLDDR